MKINKKNLITVLIGIGLLLAASGYYYQKNNVGIITDPESGQRVIKNELTILASGQDVKSLIKPYKGIIILQIKETDTYQVRFPVKDLSELNIIKTQLNGKGVTASFSLVIEPSSFRPM